MYLNKIFWISLLLFTLSNASSDFLSLDNLKAIEKKISLLNQEIAKQEAFVKKQHNAYSDIDKIKMMVYEAKVLKNEMLDKYENRQCISISYAIENMKKRLSELRAKNHPAFTDDIKKQERLLKLTQDNFNKCSLSN